MNSSQFKVGLKIRITNPEDVSFMEIGEVVSIDSQSVTIKWENGTVNYSFDWYYFSWLEPLSPLEHLL